MQRLTELVERSRAVELVLGGTERQQMYLMARSQPGDEAIVAHRCALVRRKRQLWCEK
jgi:threonine aldolase